MSIYKAFDVVAIKEHFELLESILNDYGLSKYKIIDSSDLNNCSIRSGVILIDNEQSSYNDIQEHFDQGLSICLAPSRLILKAGSISKESLFQVEMNPSYSQKFISKICEFAMFLVNLLLKDRDLVKQSYKKYHENLNEHSVQEINIVDYSNYTAVFFDAMFRDKGLDLVKVSDHIYSVQNKVEILYSQNMIACRLQYDLNKVANLGYHSDIRLDNKFHMQIMILPNYTTSRVDIACDLLVESVKHLLKMD